MKRLAFALALLVVACGGETPQQTATTVTTPPPAAPGPPTADQAREIIAKAAEFGDFEFTNAGYSIPLQRSMMNEPQREAVQELVKAKWLKFEGDTLALAAKAEGDKRFLMRPNGTLDIVPLAKKEMGTVSSVDAGPEGPVATFTWKWLPNDVGQSFTKGPLAERFAGEQSGKATLLWDGSGWTVLRITR
ncbi:MAG TPA: hypothetical protein VGF48_11960 [Thermoanaerobaculia bacterium]|jgi:hypothetical protein